MTPPRIFLARLLKNRVFVISMVLIVLGLSLIKVSYNYTDFLKTTNVSRFNETLRNGSISSIVISQPYNVTENVTFELQPQSSVHYRLFVYNNVHYKLLNMIQYIYRGQGNASNDSTISIGPTPNIQGQQYAINLTANSGSPVHVQIVASNTITLVEHSSRYVGGTGIGMALVGTVLLAMAVSRNIAHEEDLGKQR
ncbi:hypothetical protein IX51_01195 [uncultured archaeon]|nr:hypothetical protein IX51_01195 [uncultured archaeon]